MKIRWKKIAVIAMVLTTLGASMSVLAEEIESRKLSIIQIEGTEAQIARPNGNKFKAVKGMSLGQGNKVFTGKNSYVYITADDDKTFKMDDNTTIAISKASAKSLTVELQDGELFFNVEKPLGADEELNFRAANTAMSIRGTSGWLRYDIIDMEFFLVEGNVSWMIEDEEVVMNAGDRVVLERDWGGQTPAPGMPLVYKLKEKVPFTWQDLSEDALVAVMENRAKIDVALIGLNTPEKILEAAAKVEEIIEKREQAEKPVSKSKREDREEEDEPEEPKNEGQTGAVSDTTEGEGTEDESTIEDSSREETSAPPEEGVNGETLMRYETGEMEFVYYSADYGTETEDGWEWNLASICVDGYWYEEPRRSELWSKTVSDWVVVHMFETVNGDWVNEEWEWYESFLTEYSYQIEAPEEPTTEVPYPYENGEYLWNAENERVFVYYEEGVNCMWEEDHYVWDEIFLQNNGYSTTQNMDEATELSI